MLENDEAAPYLKFICNMMLFLKSSQHLNHLDLSGLQLMSLAKGELDHSAGDDQEEEEDGSEEDSGPSNANHRRTSHWELMKRFFSAVHNCANLLAVHLSDNEILAAGHIVRQRQGSFGKGTPDGARSPGLDLTKRILNIFAIEAQTACPES